MTAAAGVAFAFFNEVGIIEHLARTAAERLLPDGLSMAGFMALNHMVRLNREIYAPAQMAGALQVTKGAMTGTLRRLEAGGWIEVSPDPDDGRGKAVRLTPAGREMRETAIGCLEPAFATVLAAVAADEIAAILPTLEKIRRRLDAARD